MRLWRCLRGGRVSERGVQCFQGEAWPIPHLASRGIMTASSWRLDHDSPHPHTLIHHTMHRSGSCPCPSIDDAGASGCCREADASGC